MSNFKTTLNKGFQMTFENGWTISVQFGFGNYCDNKNHPDGFELGRKNPVVESSDAEIAIWDKNNKLYNFGSDEIKGFCSSNEVSGWIQKVSQFNTL